MSKSLFCKCLFVFLIIYSISAHPQNHGERVFEQISQKIGSGECSGAEVVARANFQAPILYTFLGLIQLDCRKNSKLAIDYFLISARQQESMAIDKLLNLGVSIPQSENVSKFNPQSEVLLRPPPPVVLDSPQVNLPVIQLNPQIQIQPLMNPNACIQDGGAIFCPNHPNSRR
jgi:hypothetical protein